MRNSLDEKNHKLDIIDEGSTMDRFMNLSMKLIVVSKEEILRREEEYKKEKDK